MPTLIDLMELHVATLFRHDQSGRLTTLNESGDAPAPRAFLGRTLEGNVWRLRRDLPASLAAELENLLAAEPLADDLSAPPRCDARLRALLAAQAPLANVWQGPAWVVPDGAAAANAAQVFALDEPEPVRATFPGWAMYLDESRPCRTVVADGVAVAICCSARTSSTAAEAGVDTLPAFRGRGYASAVVAAWARAVRAEGRTPLYSTAWDNVASQGVARRLGLALIGNDLHIT